MPHTACFTQNCPTCGRRLHVRLDDARRRVTCQHCSAKFIASEPGQLSASADIWRSPLLQRVDELLALVAMQGFA